MAQQFSSQLALQTKENSIKAAQQKQTSEQAERHFDNMPV